jgi:hypothetical protein
MLLQLATNPNVIHSASTIYLKASPSENAKLHDVKSNKLPIKKLFCPYPSPNPKPTHKTKQIKIKIKIKRRKKKQLIYILV